MAAAGAGGGHAPPAYLLLGHGALIDTKPTEIVPDGFTIVTRGKCGFFTVSRRGEYSYEKEGFFSLIDTKSDTLDPLLLQNPETLGKSLLARRLGPVLIEKSGTSYMDFNFFLTNFHYIPDTNKYMIITAGVIKTPFTHDKVIDYEYDGDFPMASISLSEFYKNTIFPPFEIVEQQIMRIVLHKNKFNYNLNDYDFLNTPIEELKANPLIVALYKCIYEKITISDFYHNYLPGLAPILNVDLSTLIRHYLPEPGVVYSLLCRGLPYKERAAENRRAYISPDRNSNNSLLSVVNRQRKENLIKRQIEEAELGRKNIVKTKYNEDYEMKLNRINRDIKQLQEYVISLQSKARSEKQMKVRLDYARQINKTRKQIEKLQKEAAYYMPRKGGGKRRTQRRRRN